MPPGRYGFRAVTGGDAAPAGAAPRRRGPSWRIYARLLAFGPSLDLAYRFSSLLRWVLLAARVYLFYALWSAVYRPGQVVGGMDFRQAVTYSVLAALQLWSSGGTPPDRLHQRVYDGTIVYFFLRPVPPTRFLFMEWLGISLYSLVWVVSGGALAWLLGLVALPASAAVVGLYLLTVVLAQIVMYQLDLLFMMSAFWTVRTLGISGAYDFLAQLLSGSLVPIWFFPAWLRRVCLWLPFQAVTNIPASLFVGRLPLAGAWQDVAWQVGWWLVLAALVRLVWLAAERRVVVHGG